MNNEHDTADRPASPLEHLVRRLRGEAGSSTVLPAYLTGLINEAADEIERLRKDAERYRFLREQGETMQAYHPVWIEGRAEGDPQSDWLHGESADDAIDAAMLLTPNCSG